MMLTCEKCQSQYNIDPQKLQGGHKVRCTSCGHVWFQNSEEKKVSPPSVEESKPAMPEAVLKPVTPPPALHMPSSLSAPVLAPQGREMPVMDHLPGGMKAEQFGLFTFLLLTFVTLIALLIARGPLVKHMPAMATLYRAAGFHIEAPGEGLRLSELVVERRLDDGKRTLLVMAKLSNISSAEKPYPSMRVVLRGPYGASIQEWDFHPESVSLAPGESIPVKFAFDDIPEGGRSVEVLGIGS